MCRNSGYIRLYRDLLYSSVWFNASAQQKVILITLLLMAQWKPFSWEFSGRKYDLKPGQLFTSTKKIAGLSHTTPQNVRTALKNFEAYGFLTQKVTKLGRLITIVNWGKYQTDDEEPNKQDNKEVTKNQQRPNKDLTKDQQRPNKGSTNKQEGKESKEGKEGKEVKKEEERKSPYRASDDFRAFAGNNEELYQSLEGWKAMRDKKKNPLTKRAVSLSLNELRRLSDNNPALMVKIVDQATMHGWQTFYPLKDGGQNIVKYHNPQIDEIPF